MDDKPDALANLYQLRLCFDGRNRRQVRIAALVHAFDVWSQVELIDLSAKGPDHQHGGLLTSSPAAQSVRPKPARPPVGKDTDLQLITETGEVLTGYALFEKLIRSLRLLWPLALILWIPGIAGVARARYPSAAERPSIPISESPVLTTPDGAAGDAKKSSQRTA